MTRVIDLTGLIFNRLTVIKRAHNKNNATYWHCLCQCGINKIVRGRSLTNEEIKSCGCYKKETDGQNLKTHGLSHTSEYQCWSDIKQRCYNKNLKSYINYGGRGIKVCDRWLDSFENFIDDMGFKCNVKYSIERINNSGNYEPSNCIWANVTTQLKNRRNRGLNKNSKLGITGVSVRGNKFRAVLRLNNKRYYLGTFTDFFNACCARKSAEAKK